MDTGHSILKSARHFFAGTALSRLSGLFRDVTMAFCFGSSPAIAAFMVAYRLANLFRRVFGESSLQSGFIPHFEQLRGENPKAAFMFYRDSAFSLALLLGGLVLFLEAVLWMLQEVVSEEWKEIARLTQWMTPGLFFICLSALHSALLQCQKKYFTPAFAPVLFNGVWMGIALAASPYPMLYAMRFLSLGITVAFTAQWLLTAVQVKGEWRGQLSWKEWFHPRFFSLEWRKIIGPMALGVLGVSAMQINSALDAIFARIADPAGPAYLWYAIRVQQLPLALFGIALSGALLPPLSRAMREGNLFRYKELLTISLRRATALMVPCTLGLFALGISGLNLLFGRGGFSSTDLYQTLFCLWAYGIGLIPAGFILLLATGSYAKKSYKRPTFATCLSVAVNLLLNILMVFVLKFGAISIALATSFSAWINCWILFKKTDIGMDFWKYFAKVLCAGMIATCLTVFSGDWLMDEPTLSVCLGKSFVLSLSMGSQLIQFGVGAAVYAISFLGIAKMLRLNEIFDLLKRAEAKQVPTLPEQNEI